MILPPLATRRSHALTALLRLRAKTENVPSSGIALAQRFAFLNHCLCCNVLCKGCVLGEQKTKVAVEEMHGNTKWQSPYDRPKISYAKMLAATNEQDIFLPATE